MSQHYITICKECNCVINQCRCPDWNKEKKFDICYVCKIKKDPNATITCVRK